VYAYQLTVRKQGEHLYVENAGTDPQTGSINVTYAGFSGAFLAALTGSLTADLAGAYGGVYRRVHLEPVPGTLSCADFPAAVSPAGIYTMETLISLSGAVIGKMLACAEPEVAELAIGPAHPVFYALICGGVHSTGQPFVATNADNMIGSLAASPAGDGVDFGGHFWIPEGTASNIEELELLWPMLFLYRRALKAGADGAGRFRGGRGFVEAGIPWTVPSIAAAVYVDESFPKAVGPFGGNPGSAGHFRLKHGTDVIARLAAGEMPQDFDAIDGAETVVEAKGPMLMIGADAVWEWTGANAPGFGDPLIRDPAQVELDIATGALSVDTAERVYGVVPGDSATQTLRLRAERLAARLAGAIPPADTPATVPANVPLRVLAGELAVMERDGRPEAFVTVTGRAVLALASGNFKDGCAVLERPLHTVAPEFATREGRAGYLMRYREYLCPVTGLRVDSEIIKGGDETLHDLALSGPSG
ncbi:MAG TPA: hydantoinase B/oxoprolinase family protein, partial [Streptosporangiaceae bacterium]